MSKTHEIEAEIEQDAEETKAESRRGGKLAENALEAVSTAPDQETAAHIMRAFIAWQTIKDYAKDERKRLNEKLAGRTAQFKEAMEVGHASTSDQILKLSVVEQRWQELEEARDEKKEVNGALREQIKAAEQKIRDLIEESKSNQMNLFSESSGADDSGGVQSDAE